MTRMKPTNRTFHPGPCTDPSFLVLSASASESMACLLSLTQAFKKWLSLRGSHTLPFSVLGNVECTFWEDTWGAYTNDIWDHEDGISTPNRLGFKEIINGTWLEYLLEFLRDPKYIGSHNLNQNKCFHVLNRSLYAEPFPLIRRKNGLSGKVVLKLMVLERMSDSV